ncbi:glycerophosphodiester phosphodiesterase [Solibacillus silvestris]|uniref:glycerophosphodiester phosphodiesterase n=1 Tax=Solibacillus silvestris TaxID=76853 RepID=UPI003F7E36D3
MNDIPIFAHRGASSFHLENTFSAFKKAKEIGADGIELDLQISKDGVLVVFHDIDLKRLAGVNKLVAECDYEELIRYNLGTRFKRMFSRERIMSFQDVLNWANSENIALNIELKESLLTNVHALKNLLKSMKLPPGSHFSSFHGTLLETVKEIQPNIETAFIITKKFDWSSLGIHAYYDAIHAHKRYYKSRYLKYCETANIGIRFYGIQGNESFLENPHSAVIGWITDFPHKVRKARNR